MRHLLLGLMLCISSGALQASQPVFKFYSKKGCSQGTCQRGIGTAVILRTSEGKVVFITAGHCLGQTNEVLINGRLYKSDVVARVQMKNFRDQVVILKTRDVVPGCASLSKWVPNLSREPRKGDKVYLVGFPGGRYKRIQTEIVSVNGDVIITRHHLKPGASGGAVIYEDTRRLAGNIHAYLVSDGQGLMSNAQAIWKQLKSSGHSYLIPMEEPVAPKKEEPVAPAPIAPVPVAPKPVKPELDVQKALEKALENERRERAKELDAIRERQEARDKAAAERIDELRNIIEGLKPKKEKPALPKPKPKPPAPKPPVVEKAKPSVGGLLGSLPWGLILGAAGVAVPGGAFGVIGLKLALSLLRRKQGESPTLFRRDTTEAEQILDLRSQTRNPIHDALFGVLWEEAAEESPGATAKELQQEVLKRFNNIAPISGQQEE